MLLPQLDDGVRQFGRRDFERRLGLFRVYAVLPGYGSRQRDTRIGRAKAESQRLFLLRACQEKIDIDFGSLVELVGDPIPLYDADWMIAPEGTFLWIDGHEWERKFVLVGLRLDDGAFIQHGRAQISWAPSHHLVGKETRGAAIMLHS